MVIKCQMLTIAHTITSSPRSYDTACSTCFILFSPIIFGALCTIANPDSSKLNILAPVTDVFLIRLSSNVKNSPTACWLNAVSLANDVASGLLIDGEGLHLMKAENQFYPAFLFSSHEMGTFIEFFLPFHWSAL